MAAFLKLPYGRLFCILGGSIAFFAIDKEQAVGSAIALIGFLFTGLGLQALAVWRESA